MATFITRIELHNANDDDYEILHAAMGKEGFTRTIKSSDGKTYKLPTAEYRYEGSITRHDVYNKAEKAAKTTKKGYWILATEYSGITFLLEEIKP